MAILIGRGTTGRDWHGIGLAIGEAVFQMTLLADGFGNAASALFRALEKLRGDDDTETRATTLVVETLAYAATKLVCTAPLARRPAKAELAEILKAMLVRAVTLATQEEHHLEPAHLQHPATIRLVADAADRIAHELMPFGPSETRATLAGRFRDAATEGLSRIRTRRPEYFRPVMEVLNGADAVADSRVRAWEQHNAELVLRFEDAPLIGEDGPAAVTLGDVYLPLRAWWSEGEQDAPPNLDREPPPETVHLGRLDELVLEWLRAYDRRDAIRLISGGPGSGKSSFARWLAAHLATDPAWRVLFIPLQRLHGSGPLDDRIVDYFRRNPEEALSTADPLGELDRGAERNWLVIFDGLDELAREGGASESQALDFATHLEAWRGARQGKALRVVLLGRVPSMQEARQRLGLAGRGTLHVGDLGPLGEQSGPPESDEESVVDEQALMDDDQRPAYWARWAAAKGLPEQVPEAVAAPELDDLTREPLLLHLLILSGYVGERWKEAADNRNLIYHAIFDRIWDRECASEKRSYLRTIKKDGFLILILMRTLALAAWQGGGRTGSEAAFKNAFEAYAPQRTREILDPKKVTELSHVALLFYTRKEAGDGQGYEFLHKSFGEFLTACALFDAFRRWGRQVDDPNSDFREKDFFERWLKIAGAAPISFEILGFLRDEVRLASQREGKDRLPWAVARDWVRWAAGLVDRALRDGLPAPLETTWREAERRQQNGELALFAVLNACALAAYPEALFKQDAESGGWEPGPVQLPVLREFPDALENLLGRHLEPKYSGIFSINSASRHISFRMIGKMLSFFDFFVVDDCKIPAGCEFFGCNFSGDRKFHYRIDIESSVFYMCHFGEFVFSDIQRCSFDRCSLEFIAFHKCLIRDSILNGARFSHCIGEIFVSNVKFENVRGLDKLDVRHFAYKEISEEEGAQTPPA